MSPVPVMPVTASMPAVTVRLATLTVAILPDLRHTWTLFGCGARRRDRRVRRTLRRDIVSMRCFRPAVRRPTVIRMTLFSQWLWPFLMEGQEKPHWRDASW